MKKIILGSLFVFFMALNSCYYHNLEDEYGVCNVPEVSTFSGHVQPLILNNCSPCHVNGNTTAGISLETYSSVAPLAESGLLNCVTDHSNDDCPNMPNGKPQLSDCLLETLNNWIDDGAQNN